VFSIVLLPLFALRAWQRKTCYSTLILALVAATAITQVCIVIRAPQLTAEHASANIEYPYILSIVGHHLFSRLFGGGWLSDLLQPALRVLGAIVGIYWIILFLVRGNNMIERLRQNFLLMALFVLLAASIFRFKNVLAAVVAPAEIARYFFLPQVIFVWLLVEETCMSLVRRTLALALLLAFIVNTLTCFRAKPLVDFNWAESVDKIRHGDNVMVPVNPPGWFFQYPGKPR
jgi:hypothetical protein